MVVLAALIAAAVAVTFTGARFIFVPSPPSSSHASLPPTPISYIGVFETGAPPHYSPVAEFTRAARRPPNMVAYYSGWTQPFAVSFARTMFSHDIIPCVQIDPTYASVAGVAAGAYDGYLRQYADSVRDFGHAVVIGFGHEMNAPWYSWGYGHVRPSDTFSSAFGRTIDEVRAFTRKPVLLSETGVAPGAGQFAQISNLFDGMHREETLGLIWFDKSQHGSIYRQNWRIEDNEAAQAAFRLGIAPLILVRP